MKVEKRNESSQEPLWVLIDLIQTPHFPFHGLSHCCDYLLCSNVLHLHVSPPMILFLSIIMEVLPVLQTPKRSKEAPGGAQNEDPAGVSSEDVSSPLWFNLFVCTLI